MANTKPEIDEGSWIGKGFDITKLVLFGSEVTLHLKTKNLPDGTNIKIDIKEYDPTWLDWDEQIESITAEGCI